MQHHHLNTHGPRAKIHGRTFRIISFDDTVMAFRSNGKLSAADLGVGVGAQRDLARSVLKATAARMIRSVERSALFELAGAEEPRTHTPEEFLAAFKVALHDAVDYAGIQAGKERDELLSQLVSMCIEELLRPDGPFDGASRTSAGVDRVSRCT